MILKAIFQPIYAAKVYVSLHETDFYSFRNSVTRKDCVLYLLSLKKSNKLLEAANFVIKTAGD